jgi:hypothetical protein
MPTITARHTCSKGAQHLVFSTDILGLERMLRKGV